MALRKGTDNNMSTKRLKFFDGGYWDNDELKYGCRYSDYEMKGGYHNLLFSENYKVVYYDATNIGNRFSGDYYMGQAKTALNKLLRKYG